MALRQGQSLLQGLRKAADLTQQELADMLTKIYAIPISRPHLARLERGDAPMSTLQARAICLALDCTEADLYDYELDGISLNRSRPE